MPQNATIEDRVSDRYAELSATLRKAADYVVENPIDVATRSLRSAAQTSGVSPATFSRLARILGFEDYEALREAGRTAVGRKLVPFSERAHTWRERERGEEAGALLHRQSQACLSNITYLDQNIDASQLEVAVEALHAAPHVLLVGSMGSAGLVDYFGYQAQWFLPNWRVAGRNGTSTAAALTQLRPGDALFALSKTPYAARTVSALREARAKGLATIVVTDSHTSPALQYADHRFVVPTENPNFFSSYAAALVLIETIMAMLLTRAGPEAEDKIRETEDQVHRLGENWPE